MITRLAIAQLRANKTYSLWTGALLTLLVAILTATVVMGATQARLAQDEARINGWGQEYVSSFPVGVGDSFGDMTVYAPDHVAAAVSNATGHSAVAVIRGHLSMDADAARAWSSWWSIVAATGEGAWIPVGEGRAPDQPGEIAVAANVARSEGLSIGDTVTLFQLGYDPDGGATTLPYEFRVVGLTSANALPGFDLWTPSAFISWEEAAAVNGPLAEHWTLPSGDESVSWYVTATWTGHVPDLVTMGEPWSDTSGTSLALPGATAAWFGAATMLLIAMIVMAFAVGRSQASARAQWIATVRTMGARRSGVAQAAAVESLILAGCAAVVGAGLGIGAAQAVLSLARAWVREPLGPAVVSLHWGIVPVATVSALIAGLIVAAVPAFWASRVAPTAALKPINDLTEAEISRRVPFVWVVLPVAIGGVLVWLGNLPSMPIDIVVVLGWIATLVGGFALLIETLRRLVPVAGRVLSRRRSPGVLSAGDELIARPRQAVAPALLIAAGIAAVTAWSGLKVFDVASWWTPASGDAPALSPDFWHSVRADATTSASVSTVLACAVTLQVVISAIAVSHRAATRSEETARVAMGLTKRQRTLAWWWVQWLPQLLGAVVGLLVGALSVWAIIATRTPPDFFDPSDLRSAALTFGLSYAALAATVTLVCGAIGSWLTARTQKTSTAVRLA